ncbi:hypothetical protein [Endozoicomonas sp. SESOKO2]|uniref:hypothetical protein n=1 Tax=Endozoicomonas sp. SESOKO2 TaxID=2828743 RepID=UPI002148CFE9|nr:hypothetical protein [Endozoicomonas sp. SESOKO2]
MKLIDTNILVYASIPFSDRSHTLEGVAKLWFPCSEVVIPAKAGIQCQQWDSTFSVMTRPRGKRAVRFWWLVSVDSRLRGNDGSEAKNDGSGT